MMKGTRIEQAAAEAIVRALRRGARRRVGLPAGHRRDPPGRSVLADELPSNVDVRLLAGALSLAEQDLALMPSPTGRRRVVLSTDIAESSLTVSGVRIVVDAGLARVPRHDLGSGMTRLTTVSTSRASADQRAGRAGRTEPGVAYRLWSKLEHEHAAAHLEAEITQVDLAGVALELAAWGTPARTRVHRSAAAEGAAARPRAAAHARGARRRRRDHRDGRAMLALPLHPRLARMVVAAITEPTGRWRAWSPRSSTSATCCAAEPTSSRRPRAAGPLVAGDTRARSRRPARASSASATARSTSPGAPASTSILADIDATRPGSVLALAFPDRVAHCGAARPGSSRCAPAAVRGSARTTRSARERFIVAADLDGNRSSARVRLGAGIDAAELEAALANEIERRDTLVWDKQRDDLVLARDLTRQHDARRAVTARRRRGRRRSLRWSTACGQRGSASSTWPLAQRLAGTRRLPAGTHLRRRRGPTVDDARLLAHAGRLAGAVPRTRDGRADLERLDVEMVLTTSCHGISRRSWPTRARRRWTRRRAGRSRDRLRAATTRRCRCACRTCSAHRCTRRSRTVRAARRSSCCRPPTGRSRSPTTCLGSGRARGPRSARSWPADTPSTSGRSIRRRRRRSA